MFAGSVPELYDKLREVREENLRHSQLVTARYLYPTLTDITSLYVHTGIRFVEAGKALQKEKKRKFQII